LNNSIHIAGIGGTFMAGLALIAREAGFEVSGCDQAIYPPMSDLLASQGIAAEEGYEPGFLDSGKAPDLFVIGNALSRGNPLVEAILNQRLAYTSGAQWLRETLIPQNVSLRSPAHMARPPLPVSALFCSMHAASSLGF